jgi:hyperosmotically inducible protein
MKLRTLAAVAAAATLAGLAGCDRTEDRGPVSTAPSKSTPPQSAPSMPSQSPTAGLPPAGPDRTAGQVVDDAGITAKVKAALLAEKGVNGMSIDVDTSQGNVTLSGKVPDQSQVERATQVALAIDGVKAVDNKLIVGS